jgi:cytochrome c5
MIHCDACGHRLQAGPDDGGSRQTLCNDCGCDLCSRCAARFSAEGGYGDDGTGVRVFAICHMCEADRAANAPGILGVSQEEWEHSTRQGEAATDEHNIDGQDRDEARDLRHEGDE